MTCRIIIALTCLSIACGPEAATPPQAAADPYPSCKNGRYILDDPSTTPGGFDAPACTQFMKGIAGIQIDDAKAPALITPLAGALLPATPIAKFTWTTGKLSLRGRPTFWQELRHGLAFENNALAAGDSGADASLADGGSTLTADAYVLVFNSGNPVADGGSPELLRVMTINTSFTPSDKQWATLQAAGIVEATVYGMHFDSGSIAGGVFAPAQGRAFTLAPN